MSEYCKDYTAVHTEACFCHGSLNDIKEFVTIVCYYSCKICSFSCTSIADIRSHIVDSHFRKTSGADGSVFGTEPKSNSNAVSNDTGITLTPNPELASFSMSNEASRSYAVGLMSKEFSTISQSGYDILSSAVVTHSAEQSSMQPLQSTTAGQPLQLFVNNQEIQLNVSNYFSGDSLQEVSSLPASVQVDFSAESSHAGSLVPANDLVKTNSQVSGQSSMGLPVEGSEQMTEMYMCDTCGTVFNSVGIIQHMLQVHGVRLDSVNINGSQTLPNVTSDQNMPTGTRNMEIAMPPNTMSIGTQAQLAKKPGRKRKVIIDAAAMSAAADEQNNKLAVSTAAKDSAAAVAVKTLGIERSTTTVGETGLSKRRIQPPRALVEDYQILRLRQSKPRIRSTTLAAPKLPCSFVGCEATFRQQQAVDYHVKCHADGGTFCCPECRSSFADWSSMLPHLWTIHGIDHYCGRCKFRANHSIAVTGHALAKHGDRKPIQPFLCSICGQMFKKANFRNQHEKLHRSRTVYSRSGTRSEFTAFRRCVCDLCKRTFANKKSLNKHIEIVHKKIKPFSCSVCGYVAARKAMLQLHERIHTGEKPFKCDMCAYSASDHNTLRRHRMRHTGQKPYHCAFCGYTAIQAISLKMHMRTRHSMAATSADPVPGATMVYSCQACRYQTVNRRSWLDHVQDHHRSASNPSTSNNQLFVRQEQTAGLLMLVPLGLQTTSVTTSCSISSPSPLVSNVATSAGAVDVHHSQSNSTSEQSGLKHILTAISEQQHSDTQGHI